jgi:hypothetical protein
LLYRASGFVGFAAVARFDVRLLRRGVSMAAETAEHAYSWLDDHATPGEPFVINAVGIDGALTTVDHGTWQPPRRALRPHR